ncbi:MAG: GMC oxidoreductase, partial [Burkholderiaceae bacterium]
MAEQVKRRWLSESAGKLLVESASIDSGFHCDVLVIGSGYGGAVAAARLAGSRWNDNGAAVSVFVLERGDEYLPGMFPAHWSDVPGHVRFTTDGRHPPRGRRGGLFDVRIGQDMNVVLGNGLGGGSLINAAVMERASADAFASGWPSGFDRRALNRAYVKAETMLELDSVDLSAAPPKLRSLMALGRAMRATDYRPVRLAISREAGRTPAGVPTRACLDCGDCVSGCNHQAKHSLDVNYLALAKARGARLFCGGTVDSIARINGGWAVDWYLTNRAISDVDAGRARLRCRKVVLAAGVLGSTEILFRSRANGLPISARLGARFSGNGDMIAAAHAQRELAQCRADPGGKPGERGVGPTITGLARVPVRGGRPGAARPIVIEEFAIPAALARIFDELVTLQAMAGRMSAPNWRTTRADAGQDAMAVDGDAMRRTMVYGVMGDDGAGGVIEPCMSMQRSSDAGEQLFDGQVRILWPAGRDGPVHRAQIASIERAHARWAIGGQVIANPLWRPFSKDLPLQAGRGPLTTVHPLGGCAMADNVDEGVVDLYGQVFDADTDGLMAGLAVLDGSIVPVALGINPSLTIAALAEQAIPVLAQRWGLDIPTDWALPAEAAVAPAMIDASPASPASPALPALPERPAWPRWGRPADDPARSPLGTRIRIRERSTGNWRLDGQDYRAAVDITFLPIDDLTRFLGRANRRVVFDEAVLTLTHAQRCDECHVIRMTGSARLLCEEPSTAWSRIVRAWPLAWRRIAELTEAGGRRRSWWRAILSAWPALVVATHVGARRSMRYRFEVEAIERSVDRGGPGGPPGGSPLAVGDVLEWTKSIEFSEAGNPWRQLSEGRVRFAGERSEIGDLALDLNELASAQRVLLTVERQRDQPSALLDLVGLAAFMLRATLQMHALSLLTPDEPLARPTQRLPGRLPGCPAPDIFDLWSRAETQGDALGADGRRLRLTRYRGGVPDDLRPTLLIHGSGASGSTFAHPAIPGNAVTTLVEAGRDVWVLDLSTSIGFEQREPVWFDDVGLQDIHCAVAFIRGKLGHELARGADAQPIPRIDVIAHCMGSAMLCAALLGHTVEGPDDDWPSRGTTATAARRRDQVACCRVLNEAIGSIVLSQVSPRMRMTPYNRFRGFLGYYLEAYLRWRTVDVLDGEHSFSGRLLDALLMTFPYPDDDHERRRAARVGAFRRIRHRADWIFGQLMHLPRVADRTLPHLASIFGWVGIEMLMQAMAFSRYNMLTDADGRNVFLDRRRIATAFDRPVLFLHGERNAIFDWRGALSSLALLEEVFAGKAPANVDDGPMLWPSRMSAPERARSRLVADGGLGWWVNRGERHCVFIASGYGHMDCLIGEHAGERVLGPVLTFLDRHRAAPVPPPRVDPRPVSRVAAAPSAARGPKRPACSVDVPQVGPIVGRVRRLDRDRISVRLCVEPRAERSGLRAVLLVPRAGGGANGLQWNECRLIPVRKRRLQRDGIEVEWPLAALRTFDDILVLTVHADFDPRAVPRHDPRASAFGRAWRRY